MRAAIIRDGVVDNIVVVDQLPDGFVEVDEAEIGDLYDAETGTFSKPPAAPLYNGVDEAITATLKKIEMIAAFKRKQVTSASPQEMASWYHKRVQALAWLQAQDDSYAPSLAIEAEARGISLSSLVNKILEKSSDFLAAEAAIAAAAGKHKDTLRAMGENEATTVAEIEAYDLFSQWPV